MSLPNEITNQNTNGNGHSNHGSSSGSNGMFRIDQSSSSYSLSTAQLSLPQPLYDHGGHISSDRAVLAPLPLGPSSIVVPSPSPSVLPNKTLTLTGTTTTTTSGTPSNVFFGNVHDGILPIGVTKSLADLQLHAIVTPSSAAAAVSSVDVPPPPSQPRFLEAFTTFTTSRSDLVSSSTSPLLTHLRAARVAITPSRSCRHRVHCTLSAANDITCVRFRVNAFTAAAGNGYIIEVQRRSGDTVQLSTLFRSLVAAMTNMGLVSATSPSPVAPSLPSLPSLSLSPLSMPSSLGTSSLSLPSFITLPSIVMPLPSSIPSPSPAPSCDASLVSSLQVQLSSTCSDIRHEALQSLLSLSSSTTNHRYLITSSLMSQLTSLVTSPSRHECRDAASLLASLSSSCGNHPSTLTMAIPSIMTMLYSNDNEVMVAGVRALYTISGCSVTPTPTSIATSRVILRQMEMVDKRTSNDTGVINQLLAIQRNHNGDASLMISSLLHHFTLAFAATN